MRRDRRWRRRAVDLRQDNVFTSTELLFRYSQKFLRREVQ